MAGDSERLLRGIVLANWMVGGDPGVLVDLGVVAEESGWDGVFLADHLIFPPPSTIGGSVETDERWDFPDPWITLAAIASRTERIRLGSWITPVARRQPWQLARDLATLDRLSQGRVIFGAGLGRRPDYETFGQPWDLKMIARRYDEALEVTAGLWSGEPFSYEGEHYTVDDAVLLPTPQQKPRIPVVIGGFWPKNKVFVRRGARWDGIVPHFPGDGVMPGDNTPPEEHLRALIEHYRQLSDEPGEIIVLDPPGRTPEYVDLCEELGVTWLLTAKRDGEWKLDHDIVRDGPPSP